MRTWPEPGSPAPRRWRSGVAALGALAALAGGAHGQPLKIEPTLDLSLTYTDNVDAAPEDERSAFVGQVSPGLSVSRTGEGARVQGRLNARLTGALRSRASDTRDGGGRSSAALGLQGSAQIEGVEDRLFVDLDAAVRRSNASVFEGRAADDALSTDRRNETRTYSVAPRLELDLGRVARAQLRYLSRWLDSESGTIGAQRLGQLDVGLTSASPLGPLDWSVDYSRNDTAYSDDGLASVDRDAVRATLSRRLNWQLRVRGNVGYERNDFGPGRSENQRIVGAGADWSPTPRTTIVADVEDRFFGTGYSLLLNHRRARSVWLLDHSRDVGSSIQRAGSVFQDPFFAALFDDPTYVERFPDALGREDAVRRELGLAGDDFVSGAHFLARRLRGAVTLLGARNTLTLSAQRTERSRLSSAAGLRPGDEFRDAEAVRSHAISASWSRRLSGFSTLNVSLTRSRAERDTATDDEIRRWLASAGLTRRLGPRAVLALTYRFQKSRGASEFRENVITASLGLRF